MVSVRFVGLVAAAATAVIAGCSEFGSLVENENDLNQRTCYAEANRSSKESEMAHWQDRTSKRRIVQHRATAAAAAPRIGQAFSGSCSPEDYSHDLIDVNSREVSPGHRPRRSRAPD